MDDKTRFVVGVVWRTALLLVLLNGAFVAVDPLPGLARVTAYNTLLPGRTRLPYADDPRRAYSVSQFRLEAMFASHVIAQPKAADEFRVVLIGDSSVWGYLLTSEQTLSAYINEAGVETERGQRVVAYNLGYPILSLAKDVLILDTALAYDPDLIVWAVTLEAFPREKQTFSPLVQHNAATMRRLIAEYDLQIDPNDPAFVEETWLDRTVWGRRRALADLLRLQVYGVLWAATGIDQDIPAEFDLRAEDLAADETYYDLTPGNVTTETLAFDGLAAGLAMAGDVPVLVVNEPMLISTGENSDIRYNFFYPRWVYDEYRAVLAGYLDAAGVAYLDAWDVMDSAVFTDSAIHMNPAGTRELAEMIVVAIEQRLARP